MQGCPLGVRHIFCLFDGHGGDSVAEFCRAHLADRIIHRVREAHATRSAAAGPSKDLEGKSIGRRDGGQGIRDGGGAAATPAVVAACVKEACREVDTEVSQEKIVDNTRFCQFFLNWLISLGEDKPVNDSSTLCRMPKQISALVARVVPLYSPHLLRPSVCC